MYYKKVAEYVSTTEEVRGTVTTRYSIVMSEISIFNGKEEVKLPSYGIEIVQQVFDDEKDVVEKWEERVVNISPYFEKVDKLAELFKEMSLSPIHLYEVIDDMCEHYISDYDKLVKLCKIAI